jgi:F-type H+-transporting ATPase subunit b
MFRLFSAVCVFLLAPALALAEDAAHGEGKDIPLRLDLTIWTIIVFGVLLLVLRKVAWGPMLKGLQGREARIRGALDEAQLARDEAHKLLSQHQDQMNKIQEKMREMLDEARREAQAMKDKMMSEAHSEIQADKDRVRREIQMETAQAKQELWNQVAQLATLVSAKVIARNLTPEDHRNLVDEAVAELNNTPVGRTTA